MRTSLEMSIVIGVELILSNVRSRYFRRFAKASLYIAKILVCTGLRLDKCKCEGP